MSPGVRYDPYPWCSKKSKEKFYHKSLPSVLGDTHWVKWEHQLLVAHLCLLPLWLHKMKSSAQKSQGRLKLLITANKYPQSQILACWYPHVCLSVWGSCGTARKIFCSDFASGLHWWTTKLCASMEDWRVSRTGSFIHSVHSTFLHACALTWKYQLHMVLIQHCSQSQV